MHLGASWICSKARYTHDHGGTWGRTKLPTSIQICNERRSCWTTAAAVEWLTPYLDGISLPFIPTTVHISPFNLHLVLCILEAGFLRYKTANKNPTTRGSRCGGKYLFVVPGQGRKKNECTPGRIGHSTTTQTCPSRAMCIGMFSSLAYERIEEERDIMLTGFILTDLECEASNARNHMES